MLNKRVLRTIAMVTVLTSTSPGLTSIVNAKVNDATAIDQGYTVDDATSTGSKSSNIITENLVDSIVEAETTSASVSFDKESDLITLNLSDDVRENDAKFTKGLASEYTKVNLTKLKIPDNMIVSASRTIIACLDGRHIVLATRDEKYNFTYYNYDLKTGELTYLPISSINANRCYDDRISVDLVGGGRGYFVA